ncbi:MAG: aldo/keto reductase [Deltaproteobacteria bacterium]|nr:aldo/keto reductase [Deltaproteobacteria bacterium]
MRYHTFGSTGLYISVLGLGTMTFGGGVSDVYSHFGAQDQAQADAMVRLAFDAGVNYFDTSNIYNNGEAEDLLGKALSNVGIQRDQVIIGSKVFGLMEGRQENARRTPNDSGLSRRHIMNSIEGTLKRLNTDLDLYQAHGFDPDTPIEETLRAFDDLINSGKVRYIGCSNWPACIYKHFNHQMIVI